MEAPCVRNANFRDKRTKRGIFMKKLGKSVLSYFVAVVLALNLCSCSSSAGESGSDEDFNRSGVIANEVSAVYVSVTGNDSASGTKENPFKTISKAVSELGKNGKITVYIAGGTYDEKIAVSNKSGTSQNPYVIRALEMNDKPVIKGSSECTESTDLIRIDNASYISLVGLELTGLGTKKRDATVTGIRVSGNSDGVVIKNCVVHDIGISVSRASEGDAYNAHGIIIEGNSTSAVNDISIIGNELYNLRLGQSEALVLNGNVDGFDVSGNKIHDCDNIGIDFIGYENTCKSGGELDRARRGSCTKNTVYNISSASNPTYRDLCADGIYVDGGCEIVIKDNIVYNCDIGIEAASEHRGKTTSDITIENNCIYNCKGYAGISFGGCEKGKNGTAVGIKIKNNTVYGCNTSLVIQVADDLSNVVTNNLFQKGIDSDFDGKVGHNVVKDNVFSSDNPDSSSNKTRTVKFVNSSSGNFRLASGSEKYAGYGYQY